METETSSESISYSTSNKMEANSNLTNTNNMNDLYNFDETLNVNIHGDPYPTNPPTYYAKKKKKTQYRKQNSPSALMGVKRSFIRRNSSCLILLQYKDVARQQKHQQNQKSPPSIIAVANAHLYWNPGFEYVKLAQSKYLLEEMHDFVTSSFISGDEIPVIICGDMNSKPSSMVHQFFTNQMGVDARMIAPWNTYSTECDDDQYDQINAKQSILTKNIAYEIEGLNIHDMRVSNDIIAHNNDKKDNDIPQVRYLLDFSLNKFTRWLRMLGIDAELETEEEEEKRTRSSDPYITLFERCKNEKRTLITTSYKLLQRKGCPPGAYLINPAAQNMEETLCHLLITHGVILEPSKFLVRCVRCNSGFREITDINEKRVIFAKNKAPMLTDLSVWECKGCMRGYWWNEAPDSSASRVKNQGTKLFRLALRSGVEYKGSLGLFDFINVEEEQRYGRELGGTGKGMVGCEDRGNNGSGIGGKVQDLEWLKDKQLSHPYKLRSMYARINIDANSSKEIVDGEILPFTNVTSDFVGALDYIFFESSKWTLTHRLVVPTTFQGMNVSQITKGHLIPSSYWPSDHLAIGGRLVLKTTKTLFQPVLNKTEQGVMHKEISKMKENKQSQNLSFLPVSLLSQMEQDMISKEPLKREKTTFSPFTNNETNTATEKVSLEQKKEDINLHQEKKKEHKLTGKCYCGCVPNILSLIEMAELRRKHREKQKLKNSIK